IKTPSSAVNLMGDTAKTKRREQLKRWAGSSTDRASDVPRKRVRFDRAAEFLAACASGDTEEAKAILPDIINCSNSDGITALHQACIDGSIEIVTFLLEHGAAVNQVDSEGWTPLHVASSCGYPDIAECVGVSFKWLNQCSTLLFATVLNVREHRGCQSISALHNADIVVICAEITLQLKREWSSTQTHPA
uniref:Uncharacterized protein n=1 Tax=Xiphophorus couchianus TaxID=32473 RepID=A0A3B5M0U4_9TELE